jgi:hypothetical protein
MSFWYLQFSQKTNENFWLYYYGTSSRIVFVRFLGELKTPKRHFEINWPLVLSMCYKHPAQPNLLTTKNRQENLRMHCISISLEPGVAENFLQIL